MSIKCYHCQVKGNQFYDVVNKYYYAPQRPPLTHIYVFAPARILGQNYFTNPLVSEPQILKSVLPTMPPLPDWHPPPYNLHLRGYAQGVPLMSIVGCRRCVKGKMNGRWGGGLLRYCHLVREIPRLPNRLKPSCSQQQGEIKGRIQTSTTYATKNRTMLIYHRFLQE